MSYYRSKLAVTIHLYIPNPLNTIMILCPNPMHMNPTATNQSIFTSRIQRRSDLKYTTAEKIGPYRRSPNQSHILKA